MTKCLYITPSVTEDGMQKISWGKSANQHSMILGKARGKNAALLHAVRGLAVDAFDYIVVIDDDVDTVLGDIPSQLTGEPLYSGRRVFTNCSTLPCRVRRVWQAFATPFLRAIQAPWGGCMAIKTDFIGRAAKVWTTSVFDDLSLRGAGYRSKEIQVDCLDHSKITWKELWRFLVRQYVDVRLGYGGWLLWLSWLAAILIPVALISLFSFWFFLGAYLTAVFLISEDFGDDVIGAHLLHLAAVPAAYLNKSFHWKGMNVKAKNNIFRRV